MLKSMIMQNIFQKTQPNAANKLNNPMAGGGGMDLSRMRSRPNSQPIVSPLNNMNPMMQALPNSALPSVTSPTARYVVCEWCVYVSASLVKTRQCFSI